MSTTPHLDANRWRALHAGRLAPDERRAVLDHLESDCDQCDEFVASLEAADEVDPVVDRTLLALREAAPQAPPKPVPPPDRRWSRTRVLVSSFAAVAASVALVVVGGRTQGGDPWREKGTAVEPPELGLAAREPGGTSFRVIADGAEVAPGSTLAFRVKLAAPACVTIWRSVAGRVDPLLDSPRCLAAGESVLEQGGVPLGLVLDSAGELTFSARISGDPRDAASQLRVRVRSTP